MTILFTGGAGYIGSHCYYEFSTHGHEVVILDNLSTGFRQVLPEACIFYKGDVGDRKLVSEILKTHKIETVVHFAGSIIVPESVQHPTTYYQNNSLNSMILLTECVKNKVKNFIFSSTAAVYGSQSEDKLIESTPLKPENPYARSKMAFEMMLEDTAKAHAINHMILRYFNVAGADDQLRTGQVSKKATHLIKVACQRALSKSPTISIFGDDYPTRDGTCIRDYIHVSDLAHAHWSAYQYMIDSKKLNKVNIFNCGYGKGFSVQEVLESFGRVTGIALNQKIADRRQGDPASLTADPSLLTQETLWRPKRQSIEEIIESAFSWEKKLQGLTWKPL